MQMIINANEFFADEVEVADRKELARELLYLYTTLDDMDKDEAVELIMEFTDAEVVEQVNRYYGGTGTIYKIK